MRLDMNEPKETEEETSGRLPPDDEVRSGRSESADEEAAVVSAEHSEPQSSDPLTEELESLLLSSVADDGEEETVQAFLSLDKDLDSISNVLDVMNQRSDDLKHRILSLLSDMKTSDSHE